MTSRCGERHLLFKELQNFEKILSTGYVDMKLSRSYYRLNKVLPPFFFLCDGLFVRGSAAQPI